MEIQDITYGGGNFIGFFNSSAKKLMKKMRQAPNPIGQLIYNFFLIERDGELDVWAYDGGVSETFIKCLQDIGIKVHANGIINYIKDDRFEVRLGGNCISREDQPALREEVAAKKLDYLLNKELLEIIN